MPKLQRSHIETLGKRYLQPQNSKQQNTTQNDPKPFQKIQIGCWYVGKVIDFRRHAPVIFQGQKNPRVILIDCNQSEIEIGQSVVYEVIDTRMNYAVGRFKEIYQV